MTSFSGSSPAHPAQASGEAKRDSHCFRWWTEPSLLGGGRNWSNEN